MFKKLLKKARKKWRLRNFHFFGLRILRQERALPLDVRNIGKVAIYVRQVDRVKDVSGAFVECGVWKGRTLLMLAALGGPNRTVWGFDSFQGFPELSTHDMKESAEREHFRDTSLPMVQKFLAFNKVSSRLVSGFFRDTLPKHKREIGLIALLCLDCDIYDSYQCCLEELYDSVAPGGVILLDEYKGEYEYRKWPGAAKAVDEFCTARSLSIVDGGGKSIIIKPRT